MRLLVFAAVSAAIGGWGTAAQAQTGTFDGNWSVVVLTERGDCDKAYRYPVIVQNGRIRYGGAEGFNVSGQVAASGSIARGSDRANVRGRLSGSSGQGTWTTSGSRVCAGRWNAERLG